MMDAVKKVGVFALALMALASAIPITANAAGEAPAITLSSYSNIFKESATGATAGRIDVKLTVPPSGLAVGESITVVLDVQRNGLNDGNLPVLSRYEIPFKNGQTTGNFYLSELDGTPQSALKGFRINASIKETTPCAIDPTKTWRTYYAPENDFDIFVENVPPVIGPGSAPSTNEVPGAIGVPFTIFWNAKDVASDQQYMKVTWTYDGSSQTTMQPTTGTYSKEIMFWSPGSKVVTLTVTDKDGGTDTRSWYYQVPGSEEKNGYTWFYTVANGEATINNYWEVAVSPDPIGQLKIPSELGGCPVRGIAPSAFAYCSGLTSVTIPSSVMSIESMAFVGCSGIESFAVDVDNPVYCSLDGLLCSKDGKKIISGVNGDVMILPSGVASIGGQAFYCRSGLKSLTIPSSVTNIGVQAFAYCSGLTSVVIPSSMTSIGSSAFYGCSGLTSVTIPSSVTSIGGDAFYGCSGLTSVTISEGVTSIGQSAFSGCSGLTSVTIPSSVTSIGSYAFSGCSGLTSVTIPSSVTSIGSYAFYGCSGLTSVKIPSSVTRIGSYAFYGCSCLTSVTIPSSVTSIGSYAFCGCSGLTSATIPEGVTNIGDDAFYGCSGLTSVTISDGVTSIGARAFYGCSCLTSVTIPSSLTSIGYRAFDDCERLTTVYVEKGDAARVRGLLEGSWSYLDCDSISFVEDWVRVDETVILPLAVIEEGMAKYPALAALAGGDVEAFAKLPSAAGKLDRSGRQMQVWQDLVAGTDPTDPDDQFKVTAIVMENGEIKVTWSPDLNENGTKNVRRYIQYGSKTIGEAAAWVDLSTVPAAEQNDYKFRKVTVGMP